MSGRRIELSVTQVASSVLAAVTGAIVASSLGVAGTIIGVAVVSFATTAGTAVYRHYLGRTRERLRSAAAAMGHVATTTAPQTRPDNGHPGTRQATGHGEHAYAGIARPRAQRAAPGPVGAQPASGHAPGDEAYGGQGSGRPPTGQPGGPTDETWIIPAQAAAQLRADAQNMSPALAWADGGQSVPGGDHEGDGARQGGKDAGSATVAEAGNTGPDTPTVAAATPGSITGDSGAAHGGAQDGTTSDGGTRDSGTSASGTPGSGGPDEGGPGQPRLAAVTGWLRNERWVKFAGIAVMIFVLAMGGITILEAATGKPLDALIWGQHNSGTTVGNVVSGPAHRTHPPPSKPAGTPAPHPTPTPHTPAPTPSTTEPTPTPKATAPTPTPTPTTHSPTATPAATRTPSARGAP